MCYKPEGSVLLSEVSKITSKSNLMETTADRISAHGSSVRTLAEN
jgi:hypothetical protein